MNRILILATLLSTNSAFCAPGPTNTSPSQAEEAGVTLPDYISQIAEKDEITAEEYANMASGTMQVAMQVLGQGEKMPEPPLRDALDAVVAGRAIDPEHTDWDQIEQRLLDLLNPPHQEEQEQQDSESSEDQEGEEDGEEEQQDGQSGSSEEGGEQSEESEQQQSEEEGSEEQEDGQQGEDGEQQDSQEGQDGEQDGQEQQSNESDKQGEQEQMPNTQDGAQMGELDQPQEEQQVELDGESQQPQPAQQEQMQTLGGQQGTGEPVDAEMAALKQLLEQLKQQDEPGKLYQILQEAQTGGKKKQQPNAKDW